MTRVWIVVVALAAAPGCRRSLADTESPRGAPNNAAGVAPGASSFCALLCAQSAPLKCVAAVECPAFCDEMLNTPICQAEMHAALTCFIAQPAERWRCDTNGLPTIAEGPCDAEQEAYRNCRQGVAGRFGD